MKIHVHDNCQKHRTWALASDPRRMSALQPGNNPKPRFLHMRIGTAAEEMVHRA